MIFVVKICIDCYDMFFLNKNYLINIFFFKSVVKLSKYLIFILSIIGKKLLMY